MKQPTVPKALLEYLEATFKAPLPTPKNTLNEVMYQAGQRQVVEHLRHLYTQQEESN